MPAQTSTTKATAEEQREMVRQMLKIKLLEDLIQKAKEAERAPKRLGRRNAERGGTAPEPTEGEKLAASCEHKRLIDYNRRCLDCDRYLSWQESVEAVNRIDAGKLAAEVDQAKRDLLTRKQTPALRLVAKTPKPRASWQGVALNLPGFDQP